MNYIEEAKLVFSKEIEALEQTIDTLDETFIHIVDEIVNCSGKVVLCGMGKSGHIANKISASLSSLGTPSFSLHPAEALHGDLGMVAENDVVILISHSGESEEITRIIPSLKLIGPKLIAITAAADSTLARECEIVQIMPRIQEACALNLAPTSSTTMVLVYGDALAVVASKVNGFGKEDFALFHPAGMLGKKLLIRVSDIMATGDELPIIEQGDLISDAIMEMSNKALGVVIVSDSENRLIGVLTDGDLRRAIEKKIDLYEDIVDNIMTVSPKYIGADMLAIQALKKLRDFKINNYPVVDEHLHIIGVLTWQQIIRAGIVL